MKAPTTAPLAFAIGLILASAAASAADGPQRWEGTIRKMEARDALKPPPKGGVALCGSSSARGWDVGRWFPGLPAVNRGFGGSQIADSSHYADRIIVPLEPRVVVLYGGDNDVAAGKSPQMVLRDFKAFVCKVQRALPKTHIIFISIKPSIRRWRLFGKMAEVNRLVADLCHTDPRLTYLDVATPMLGEDGTPRKELFVRDGLHLNSAGYRLWTSLLLPHLKKHLGAGNDTEARPGAAPTTRERR